MTLNLLDQLTSEIDGDARFLLECIGALKRDDTGKVTGYCLYNLWPTLQEVDDYIIPAMMNMAENSDLQSVDERLTNGLKLLQERIQQSKMMGELHAEVCPDLRNRKLMQGYMVDFSLYSLLPYFPAAKDESEKFRQYKGLLLLCAIELKLHAANKNKNYTAALRGASSALRLLTESPLLMNMPEIVDLSIEEVYQEFVAIASEDKLVANPTEIGYFRALTAVFRFAAEKTGGVTRRKRVLEAEIDATEIQSTSRIRTSRATQYSTSYLRAAKKSGLALAELASDVELLTQDDAPNGVGVGDGEEEVPPSKPMLSLARQAMTRQRQLEGVEKGAQLLPISTNRLTPGELATFFVNTDKVAQSQNLSVTEIEAAAALQTSFWLSKTLLESLRLVIYASHANLPASIPTGFLGYLQDSHEWVIPSTSPKGAPKHKGVDLSAAIAVQEIIRLPDVTGAHEYLAKLKAWDKAKVSQEGARAFESPGVFVEIASKNILKLAKKDTHSRVTFGRLKDTVFLTLLDACQDKATAILTLARPHRLGDTQLHYTTVRIGKMQELYVATCRKIMLAIGLERNTIRFGVPNLMADEARYEFSDQFAGCPICPTARSVSRVSRELAEAVELKRRSMTDAQSRVDFFNLYTSYTIFLLWHVTGVRAVSNPIPSFEHIDFENALLLASDKDDYTSFNTRLVPLVPVLCQQLQYHILFKKDYLGKYQLQFPKLAKRFRTKLDKEKPFFYLIELTDKGQKPVEASPSAVMDHVRAISPWFGLPDNCQRPRLRSLLLERDCHPQWIDALLGHWTRGEEPWHRFACTALARITQDLRRHLEQIAAQDGWKAIQGDAI